MKSQKERRNAGEAGVSRRDDEAETEPIEITKRERRIHEERMKSDVSSEETRETKMVRQKMQNNESECYSEEEEND